MVSAEDAPSWELGPEATDQSSVPDYVLPYLRLEAFKGTTYRLQKVLRKASL